MSFNIEVQGGKSVRLPTKGKYCDRDIVVTAMGGGGGNSRLPAGYTEVEYLQSDGNQYIDTGWAAKAGEVLTLEVALSSGTGESAFGGYADQVELYFKGNSASSMTLNVWSNFTKATVLEKHNGSIVYNQKYPLKIRFDSDQTDGTVYLFRYRLDRYPFTGRIYPVLVENASGEKVHHFIPCFNSDSEYGMYDIAADKFHGNLGSGAFTGGPVVDAPVVSGTIDITTNGEHNVATFEKANVQVPIPDGYIQPSGTKEITENGTHNVREYESIEVSIESGGGNDDTLKQLIEGTLTSFYDDQITHIRTRMFGYNTALKEVELPNAKTMGMAAFASATALETVKLDSIETLVVGAQDQQFYSCTSLKNVSMNSLKVVGAMSFDGCTALKQVYLPSLTRVGGNGFIRSGLETAHFPVLSSIGTSAFASTKLATLVLGGDAVVTLDNVSAFTGTPFAAGGTGGTAYVKQALIPSYQTATNWSALYAAGTCEFVAIEGSEYE